ncbi:MAG: glycosyltransferase family 2 protein [Actinomycetota bacterium]|nr:glycosyltransferase family 2 protein [Actinomycetota bacterium]
MTTAAAAGPPSVRVVVVTYSPGGSLADFLDSLATATRSPVEVVLADNGSTDGVPERAAAERPGVRLLPTGGNIGYGRAANAGAAGAQPDWLVVANPDIVWSPGSLDTLLTATARWPAGGSFGPAIRTPAGELYPSARAFPSLGRGIGHALCGWWWPANPWTAAYRRERGLPREGPTGWLSGSCLLLRRSAFENVGGFDPSYFMYFEDLDLCARLVAAGWQNVHVPSAVVTHIGAHATKRDAPRMLAAHHRSAYRYLSRRYAGARHAPLRLLLAGGLAVRYLLARRLRRVADGPAPTRLATLLGETSRGDRPPTAG